MKQGGVHYSYFYDGKGNVEAVLDREKNVAAAYRYDPFGRLLAKTGALEQPFQFSTKRFDELTGLLYYGYRFYAADIGRWTTRDPLGEIGGMNLYAFVGNAPVNSIDVLGLKWNYGDRQTKETFDPMVKKNPLINAVVKMLDADQTKTHVLYELPPGAPGYVERAASSERIFDIASPGHTVIIDPTYAPEIKVFDMKKLLIFPTLPIPIFIPMIKKIETNTERILAHELGHVFLGTSDENSVILFENMLTFPSDGYLRCGD